MILEYEDSDLDIIARYFKHDAEEYQVYEATRFLCYHNRQNEILTLIREHYQQFKEKIDILMKFNCSNINSIEEESILFDMSIDLWNKFKDQIKSSKEVLKYLDIKTPLNKYLSDILLSLIKPSVETCLQQVTLLEIKRYRQLMVSKVTSQASEPPIQLFDLLILLPNYFLFEQNYLSQTQTYYSQYLLDTDPTQSVLIASKIQQVELQLAQKLSSEFQQQINDLLRQYIYNQINLHDLDELYFNTEHMRNYVAFAQEINALPKLLSGLRKHIYKEVIIILRQAPDQTIQNLMILEKRSILLFQQLFVENTNQTIVTHAIEDAINENYEKFSYALAYSLNPQDEYSFEKYGHLIKYLNDKESLQNYYVKFLVQRIIKNCNLPEETNLHLLQQYCNSEWIADCLEFVKGSKDSLQTTNQYLHKMKQKRSAIQFHFQLIPKSIWPYPLENIILPNPLDQYAEGFIKSQSEEQMYQKKKIVFQSKSSKLLLSVNIDQQFQLDLPLSLGLELLHFNNHKQVSEITNYKQYNGLVIKSDHNTYRINYQYKAINSTVVMNEEIHVEMEKSAQGISDYLYVVDAAIVKIIKQNKHMLYENLIQATLDLIKKEYPRFIDLCEFEIIEKQITSLLEKEVIRQRYDVYELL